MREVCNNPSNDAVYWRFGGINEVWSMADHHTKSLTERSMCTLCSGVPEAFGLRVTVASLAITNAGHSLGSLSLIHI